MGRKKFSELPPEVAARYHAEMAEIGRKAWKEGKYADRKNGVYNEGIAEQISKTVSERWAEGAYANRLNGMTGVKGSQTPNWLWGKPHYSEILKQFEEPVCAICGEFEEPLNAHHIDEDHNNYLLGNLQWTCVPCHMWRYHYNDRKGHIKFPFITLGKKFSFEYSHILPWHPGKCHQFHGHSGHLDIRIRARINPFGVVEDFHDISAIVKMAIIDRLDHRWLNEFIENPTTENFLVYAWQELEIAGLKGLTEISFAETDNSYSTLTKADMLEAFGWDLIDDKWELVRKEVADD